MASRSNFLRAELEVTRGVLIFFILKRVKDLSNHISLMLFLVVFVRKLTKQLTGRQHLHDLRAQVT